MLSALITLLTTLMAPPHELSDFLSKPDPAYSYRLDSIQGDTATLEMTSQIWHDIAWKHKILYRLPKTAGHRGEAILYITGDGPRPGDYTDIALMSTSTRMPIAMLFDEPNQPLFGLREDDLIAYTFQKYLETGDESWPLLFPMTKAAIRAMDAIVDYTKNSENPITSFVITGASKRGWTTWMTGASDDPRIRAIAPMVYDNLNIPAQMPHQIQQWGAYSEMIEAYTKLGLQSQLGNEKGRKLAEMVDPYSYRARFHVPILVVKGSNDPYWTADAADYYYNSLRPPHWMFTVPNAGHTLNGGFLAAQTIGAFARAISGEFPMPKLSPSLKISPQPAGRLVSYRFRVPSGAYLQRVWLATSVNTDFRKSKYAEPHYVAHTPTEVSFVVPNDQNAAFFLEADFKAPDGHEFGLSTPTKVLKRD